MFGFVIVAVHSCYFSILYACAHVLVAKSDLNSRPVVHTPTREPPARRNAFIDI